ncbi:PilC/PilY family type IV pilus protein [Pseudomonas sp. R2.Fl]|nr:PilC/PilY family type IV pilus protein [Pseudomonas sp. R2.Fl]
MKPRTPCPRVRPDSRIFAGAVAFLVTLLCAPVRAAIDDVPIPANPLVSGSTVAPNIMLLLNNSLTATVLVDRSKWYGKSLIRTKNDKHGGFHYMGEESLDASYTYNLLHYDPRMTYQPWVRSDGSRYPDMDPQDTYMDLELAVPTHDRATDRIVESPRGSLYGWDPHDPELLEPRKYGLLGRPFYVFDPNGDDTSDLLQYTLYRLVDANTAWRCTTVEMNPNTGIWERTTYFWMEQGKCERTSSFTWTTADGRTIHRSLAEEWKNYANWYGYHRSRMKVGKAAAGEAFSQLPGDYRVGYMNLATGIEGIELPIPVHSDGGRFRDKTGVSSNRSAWFDRMYGERASRTMTVLHTALQNAGEYFSRTDAEGPWGPGNPQQQAACRQSHVIVASNGFWEKPALHYQPVGNVDDTPGKYIDGPDGRRYRYQPGPPYSDKYANTLADLVMHYWKNDLRPDLPNTVPTSDADPAFWQHMVVSAISVANRGYLTANDLPLLVSGQKSWSDPHGTDWAHRVDDLFHATVNSRGMFVQAEHPHDLVKGLTTILDEVEERNSSASSISFNGAELKAGSRTYVASFTSKLWTGDLKAYPVTASGISATPIWSAAGQALPIWYERKVFTTGDPGQGGRHALRHFPTLAQGNALGARVATWIRGDRSREGKGLRKRAGLLGDIVHSSPLHVKTANAEAIFVGANDGMLHAFDAATGKEIFAYVPGLLDMASLKYLAEADKYRHRYYVDGPLVAGRIHGDEVTVIGTLGRGGRGVYAVSLNLANPSSAPAGWEYAGDQDMGMVLARPQIHRLAGQGGTARTVALVANGINSPSGRAALYVLDAETGKQIGKIVAGNETGNGLSALTVLDRDGDGLADTAYAGDLRGNVWRFDLDGTAGDWQASRIFIATGANGRRQPVTGGVGAALHPATQRPWVFFGTGSYLSAEDAADVSTQSWYGVEDRGGLVGRSQLRARRINASGTIGGKPVRAFSKASANDMVGKRGWVVDLQTPGAHAEGERMVGETQQVVGGRTLLASSMIPEGGGCGGAGRGYLNAIDVFTGGATSNPFFDVNGDGRFDGRDHVSGTPAGSIDLGLGMVSDPGILLGDLVQGTNPSLACVGGASGATGCVPLNLQGMGPRYGRVSWLELIRD